MSTIERLNELALLSDGWLDGDGVALTENALIAGRALAQMLEKPPRIFPTPEGGLMFEWSIESPRYEFGIELDANGIDIRGCIVGIRSSNVVV